MPTDAKTIENLILAALPDAQVHIEDLRGDGDHYSAHVVSAAFEGKSRVEQHRMVQNAVLKILGAELHALAIQTATPKS